MSDARRGAAERSVLPDVRPVSAAQVRAMLADGGELALLDVREEQVFPNRTSCTRARRP